MLRRFLKSQGGNFAISLAVALPALIAAVGVMTDYAVLVGARSTLQSSLDSALLASSKLGDANDSRQKTFDAFLAVNMSNHPNILTYKGDLDVSRSANTIESRGKITADIRLFFMNKIYDGKMTVKATVYQSSPKLEVAMVLDNTGSMGSARMKSLREAATALANILEGASSDTKNIRAALVPFVTAVNVKGKGFKNEWIDVDAEAPYHGANFDPINKNKVHNHLDLFKHLKVDWKGCVEARPAPYNLSDAEPDKANPSTLFVPYFAPDNPGAAGKSPNSGTAWNNSYLGDTFGSSDGAQRKDIVRYFAASTPRYIDERAPRSTGPNYACPTPIEPLTDDFDELRDAIAEMVYWEGSGTNVSEGLAWGMRVLSPEEPYTQGSKFDPENVTKAVVLFTDGENTVFGASSQAYNTSDYGSYGFLNSGRLGTSNRNGALSAVNEYTLEVCTTLKKKGVQIYAVLLGADTAANRKLYTACVSTPDDYYPTNDVSELRTIFEKIGNKFSALRLTQ